MRALLFSVLTIACFVAGCATPGIQSQVSVFHKLADVQTRGKVSVVPMRREIDGLEFASYEERVSTALRAKGFEVGPVDSQTRYAAFLDYGIDEGQIVTATRSVPQIGVTGYSGATTTGTVSTYGNTATVNASTVNTPTYGVTGYRTVTDSARVFARFVRLQIVTITPDQKLGEVVYEGRVRSDGTCGNLAVVMPTFLDVLLSDFPGPTGGRTVKSEWTGDC